MTAAPSATRCHDIENHGLRRTKLTNTPLWDNLTKSMSILENAGRLSNGNPFDLGSSGRKTSTRSAQAQRWFDRGLVWSSGFNHEEAVRCFESTADHDEGFAFAHWGVTYASGPNYNKQWDAFDDIDLRDSLQRAHAATQRALELCEAAPDPERDLIAAIAARYPSPNPVDDLDAWASGYADAMRAGHERHADDLDVAALCADALLNVSAWSQWDLATGEPAGDAHTLEARASASACSSSRPTAAAPRRSPLPTRDRRDADRNR